MELIRLKLIKKTPNWKFILNNYIGVELEGRRFPSGNVQAKLKKYTNWFDVPKDCIQIL